MDRWGRKHVELTYVMNKTQSLKNFVYLVGLHIYYKMIHGPYNIKYRNLQWSGLFGGKGSPDYQGIRTAEGKPHCIKVKVTVLPIQATKALRVGRGIALPFLRFRHWRWVWGVSTTPWPLYSRERLGTHCSGDWVGPRAGLDGCEKSRPHRDSVPGLSSP